MDDGPSSNAADYSKLNFITSGIVGAKRPTVFFCFFTEVHGRVILVLR